MRGQPNPRVNSIERPAEQFTVPGNLIELSQLCFASLRPRPLS